MRSIVASCAALILAVASVRAATVTVQVGNPTGMTNPQKFQFMKKVTNVNVGDTVKFVFMGNHSVTQQMKPDDCKPGAPNGGIAFDSQVLSKGKTFTLPASSLVAGTTIQYYCKVGNGAHCRSPNFMQGSLVVGGGSSTAAKNTTDPASASTTSKSVAAPQSFVVQVGLGGNKFTPSTVSASPGDTVKFLWVGGTHNVVPSDAAGSCTKSAKADTDADLKSLASGAPQTSGEHSFAIPNTAAVGTKFWYFCSVATHCSVGKMFGTIKVVAPGTATNAKTDTAVEDPGNAASTPAAGATAAAASSEGSSLTIGSSAFVMVVAAIVSVVYSS